MASEISRNSSLAAPAVSQDSRLTFADKSELARHSLIRMATQLTTGTGVKSGYLQLSAGNQQLGTRWLGANAGTQRAVAEVRRLVSEAYGDLPGADEALDRYLDASGDRIGTRSFVKLVKALETAGGRELTQALQDVEEGEARLETDHLSAGVRLLGLQHKADELITTLKDHAQPGSATGLQAWCALSALEGQLGQLNGALNADQRASAQQLGQQVAEHLSASEQTLVTQFADAHTHLEGARQAMASRPQAWQAHQDTLAAAVKDTIALLSSPEQSPLTDQAQLMCTRALLRYYTAGGQAGQEGLEGFVKSMSFDRLLAQTQLRSEAGDEIAKPLHDALSALADTSGVNSAALPAAELTKTLAAVPHGLLERYSNAFNRFAEQALKPGPQGKVAAWREVHAAGIAIFSAAKCKSQDDRLAMSSALIAQATQRLSMSKMASVLMALQDQETLRTLLVASALTRGAAKVLDAGRIRLGLPFMDDHLLSDLASNIELDEETGLARMIEGVRARVRGLPGPMPGLEISAESMIPPRLSDIDAATAEAVRRDLPEMTMHELVMRAQITNSEPFAKLNAAQRAPYLHAKEVLDAIDDIDLRLGDRQKALLARVMDHPSALRQTNPEVGDAFISAVTAKAAELLEALEDQGRMLTPEELFGILTAAEPTEQERAQMAGDLAGVIAARVRPNAD